ncbi:hypothetical protein D3C84_486550 [compost metagenome]
MHDKASPALPCDDAYVKPVEVDVAGLPIEVRPIYAFVSVSQYAGGDNGRDHPLRMLVAP